MKKAWFVTWHRNGEYSSWRHRFGKNRRMVKNTKTWLPWEWNITFLRNKKILNLCLRWHILRSYRFAAEVTFIFHKTVTKKGSLSSQSSGTKPAGKVWVICMIINLNVLFRDFQFPPLILKQLFIFSTTAQIFGRKNYPSEQNF